MDWRWMVVVVGLGACGPTLDSSADEDTGDASSSSDDGPQSSTVGEGEAQTGDPPPPDPPVSELSGTYLLAVATVIAPATPLQWLATVAPVEQGAPTLTITLQSLSLEVNSTTTPRQPVGAPFDVQASVDVDGNFVLDLGAVAIDGAANPITGSDIEATVALAGVALSPQQWCGTATGMVTVPLQLDLTGSTFAFTPISGTLPDPVVASCTP